VKTSLEVLSLQAPNSVDGKVENSAYIDRAQTGINTLNLILTNMSEATQLEQMLINTDKSAFNIKTLIKGCITGYQQIYTENEFTLKFDEKTNSIDELIMFGSPEHLVQLLDKVINNAVEFSNDNHISIDVFKESNTLRLAISNNGVHLPEAMDNSLFDSMISIRNKSKQTQPHLGLGLYIARLICQFHQGKITAKNHYDKDGVTLTIELPLSEN
jgi:signal transduction histidine kinase